MKTRRGGLGLCGLDRIDGRGDDGLSEQGGIRPRGICAEWTSVRNGDRNARYVFAFLRTDNEFIPPDVRGSCAWKSGRTADVGGGRSGRSGRRPSVRPLGAQRLDVSSELGPGWEVIRRAREIRPAGGLEWSEGRAIKPRMN